jgi:hypothetical protein
MRLRSAKRRKKVFGEGKAVPLDRNGKHRVWAFAVAFTAFHRRKGQHLGPLTRATLDVLRVLLWGFHNAKSGRCFPSYQQIAERAKTTPKTVGLAIQALEAAGVLSWENRLIRRTIRGQTVPERTTNAYWFYDPAPEAPKFPGTIIQDSLYLPEARFDGAGHENPLEIALRRLGKAFKGRLRWPK